MVEQNNSVRINNNKKKKKKKKKQKLTESRLNLNA
jgi:hypothetical protein